MKRMATVALAASVCVMTLALADQQRRTPNTLNQKEREAGWKLLFDGKTATGWRGYRQEKLPDAWQVKDGALTLTGKGGDIIYEDAFEDFVFKFDWKIAPNGNSGVFYRVDESLPAPYLTGPEYQILDNNSTKYGDAKIDTNIAGSNYGLHESDRDAVKEPGKWNKGRIVVKGNHVEHWLNGKKVVAYELGSEAWKQRVKGTKFANWKHYGTRDKGHLVLQDHGDEVAFRNLKVREIKKTD